MASQRNIISVWRYFDEKESENKVVCRLCKHKLAYNQLRPQIWACKDKAPFHDIMLSKSVTISCLISRYDTVF